MSQQWVPKKPNFGPPPPGYVPGIGRGATGFVTRSDLGPAARTANLVAVKQSQIDEAAYSDTKYNSWEGYRGALFGKQQMDEEDKQADDAFDFCEKRMEERRLKYREQNIKKQLQKQKKDPNNIPISEQFTDLKRQLAKVSTQQWANLPESEDKSIKKRKKQKYTPVPDSMLVNYLTSNVSRSEVQAESNQDFRDAKSILLKSHLQKAQNEVSGKSIVDKVGYLTHLDTSRVDQQMIGDIKRARLLHKSALNSNPRNPDIWLSAARIEQLDGKMMESRAILRKALEYVPNNEDIWIELSRVEKYDEAKNVLIEGLRHIPSSEKIWLKIARLEDGDKQMKSKVLRKGLENLPQSTKLWKQLIQLSELDEAKKLMYRAVQCLPKQIDLWIGLAKLQTYDKAKQVLNQARKANPLNLAIWISAAKLQQSQSSDRQKAVNKIQVIITKGRQILKKNGNSVSRQQFLQQALFCEKSGNLITCESIVKSVISLGLTEEELNHSLFKDTDLYEKQFQSIYTTRYMFKYGILITKNPRIFEKMLQFEQRLASADLSNTRKNEDKHSQLFQTMKFGLSVFPDCVGFWLTLIDKLIDRNNYQQAQNVIQTAISQISSSQVQKLYLKKVDLLQKQSAIQQARKQLKDLCLKFPNSPLSSVSSIWLQFHEQQYKQAWSLCETVFKKFPKTEQIWQLAIRIKRKIGTYQECKKLAQKAVGEFPKTIKLWQLYYQLQLQFKFDSRARALLDKALMKNPKNQQLYLLLIELEIKYGNKKQLNSVLAKALKDCPKSGQIWGIAILNQPHNLRKKKASIAVQQCGVNSFISCAIAKLFWKDNKVEKARKWLQDSLHHNRTNGDIWAYYLKFMKEQYGHEYDKLVEDFREVGKIRHGRKWMRVREEWGDGWKYSQQQVLNIVIKEIGDEIHELN